MDYNTLLDTALALGQRLQLSGAETYRVEEAVSRLLKAYGAEGDVFSIPNCIILSVKTGDNQTLTRMCRISGHGTDLDRIEQYSNLSRRLCSEAPPLDTAAALLKETDCRSRSYGFPAQLAASFVAAAGFAMFFQGSLPDAVAAGISGIVAGFFIYVLDRLNANSFFKTLLTAFMASACSCLLSLTHLVRNLDAAIIGPLTILVPGFLFTNSMRDIIYGDTMSGVNRLVQVIIVSLAIAIGSSFAVAMAHALLPDIPQAGPVLYAPALQCFIAFVACVGFCVLFNIHGIPGLLLCALGSSLGWAAYQLVAGLGMSEAVANLTAAVCIASYAEIMARVRKYPATSYLVISLFPLFPGAYLYYALCAILAGNNAEALAQIMHASVISGGLAVGVLLVSTITRMLVDLRTRKLGVKLP